MTTAPCLCTPHHVCTACRVLPPASLLDELASHDSEMSVAAKLSLEQMAEWIRQATHWLIAADSECSAIAHGRPPDKELCQRISDETRALYAKAVAKNAEGDPDWPAYYPPPKLEEYLTDDPQDV